MATFGPTSYDVRSDIRRFANHVSAKFGCSWNTYVDHPPGLGLDFVSVDFWGPGGRGDFLPREKARSIARYLRRRSDPLKWRWIINGPVGYYPDGTRFTPPGGAEWNAGHVHVTYW